MRPSLALSSRAGQAVRTARGLAARVPAAIRRIALTLGVLVCVPVAAAAQISVSPSYDAIGNSGPNPYTFTIENDGSRSTTALLQVSCSDAVTSCGLSTSSVFVGASGGQSTVTVTYTTSGNGTGSFTVTATDRLTQQAAQGTVNVTMPNALPSVTANMSTAYTAENFNTSGLQFTITNTGNTAAQYTLTPNCGGNVSGCSVSSPTGSLSHNQSATVSVNFTPGAATAGNGTISLTATGPASLGSQASTSPTVTVVPLSEAVQVTPDGDTLALTSNDTVVVPFTVRETGNGGAGFRYALQVSCSGSMVGCTFVTTGTDTTSLPPGPGVDQTVQVRLTGTSNLAGGYGAVSVIASYNNGVNPTYQDEGTYGTTIPDTRSYTPSVTPKGDSVYYEANTPYSVAFTVKNVGNTQATYTITQPTACSGQAAGTSCTVRASDLNPTVSPGSSATVHVDFTTGPRDQRAHIYLRAQATAGSQPSDAGSWLVVPLAPTVQVTAPTPITILTNATASLQFHVKNTGTSGTVAYHLQVTGCTAPLVTTGCTVPDSIIVVQGADSIVTVQVHAQGTTGAASVMLHASKQFYNTWADSAVTSVTVSSRLSVSTAFMNNDNQDVRLCANACFAVSTARSTVPYYTLDTPRSVTLVYNSDRAFPRPFVYADVSFLSAPPAGIVTYQLQARHDAANLPFTNGETTPTFQDIGTGGRLAGQIDLSAIATGTYDVSLVVTAVYSDGSSESVTVPTKLLIVNASKSASVAKGWTVGGVPRLYPQADTSALITDGAGSALLFVYRNGGYSPPSGDFTTLAALPGNAGWVRTALDGTKVWFRPDGLVDSVTDRLGFGTVFEYDGFGRLWKIHDPMLRKTKPANDATVLAYGTYGLASIQEPSPVVAGRTTRFQVGSDSLLVAVVDPDDDSTSYTYDSFSRLHTATGRTGGTVTYTYGSDWKLSQIISPQVAVDSGGGRTTLQQPTVTLHPWQSVGVPTGVTLGAPAAPRFPYPPTASIVDPVGDSTNITVNAKGEPLVTLDPIGNQRRYGYTGNFVTSVSIPDGTTTFSNNYYVYSGPYLTSVIEAGADTVNYQYGTDAQVTAVFGAGVISRTNFLNSKGQPDSVEYAEDTSRIARFKYDTLTMRADSVIDPAGHVTRYAYDQIFGNLYAIVAPGNRTDSVWFDGYGRDTLNKAPAVTHVLRYDAVNRLTLDSIPGVGSGTRFAYTHTSLTITDPLGQAYQSDFNSLGWKVNDYSPATTVALTYRYDARGLLTSRTNRRGQVTSFTYDSLGRVRSKLDPIAGTTTYSYSGGGFTAVASNSAFSVTTTSTLWCVSPNGNAVDGTCRTDSTRVTYAGTTYVTGHSEPGSFSDSVATSVAVEDGALSKHWYTRSTTLGVPDTVNVDQLTLSYVYDAKDGLRTQTNFPTLGTMADSFTTNHEVYWRQYSNSTVDAVFQRAYHYDLAGRLDDYVQSHNGLATAAEIRQYGYDAAGRFSSKIAGVISCNGFPGSGTSVVDPNQGWQPGCSMPNGTQTYQYDPAGNRTHTLVNGGSDVRGWYTADRVDSMGTRKYLYDADGNTTHMSDASTGEARDYYYDASGLLDSVIVVGGNHPGELQLKYDPYGQVAWRMWTSTSSPSTQRLYLYNDDNLVKEIDLNNGGAATDYEYDGIDHPILRVIHDSNGNVTSTTTYLYDEIGRVDGAITNGVTTPLLNYDDWGEAVGSGPTAATLRFGFKGMLYDEDVDLYYARNRWYDPKLGRFTQADPIGLGGGTNPYVFADNDPINERDPGGLLSATTYRCPEGYGTYLIAEDDGVGVTCRSPGGGVQRLPTQWPSSMPYGGLEMPESTSPTFPQTPSGGPTGEQAYEALMGVGHDLHSLDWMRQVKASVDVVAGPVVASFDLNTGTPRITLSPELALAVVGTFSYGQAEDGITGSKSFLVGDGVVGGGSVMYRDGKWSGSVSVGVGASLPVGNALSSAGYHTAETVYELASHVGYTFPSH